VALGSVCSTHTHTRASPPPQEFLYIIVSICDIALFLKLSNQSVIPASYVVGELLLAILLNLHLLAKFLLAKTMLRFAFSYARTHPLLPPSC
jgi:hypothetical protein